jgi:hypothetical protein
VQPDDLGADLLPELRLIFAVVEQAKRDVAARLGHSKHALQEWEQAEARQFLAELAEA